jgi:hypothetical protein
MAITRQSFAADTASLLQQTYQQKWLPTNWESSAAPKLPAGMTLYIGGVPYVVDTADYTLGGSPADGTCYIKITPNSGDGGATADAILTNTFSGTWNEAWNDFYDSTAIFLNFFCTKSGSNYTAKGQWLNYRERKIQAYAGVISTDGNIITSANVEAVDGNFTGEVNGTDAIFSGSLYAGLTRIAVAPTGSATESESAVQTAITLPSITNPGEMILRKYTYSGNRNFSTPSTAGRKYYIEVIYGSRKVCGVFGPAEVVYNGGYAEIFMIRIQ